MISRSPTIWFSLNQIDICRRDCIGKFLRIFKLSKTLFSIGEKKSLTEIKSMKSTKKGINLHLIVASLLRELNEDLMKAKVE